MEKSERMLVIMNPCAGTRQANKLLTRVLSIFCSAYKEVEIAMTQASGDGETIAKERSKGFDTVVAIGGDGTFNEVVAGVLASGEKVKIGYIPAGTTNDFASSLGLDKSIIDAAETIVKGKTREIDIGSFNGRYYSYVASFGAFTSTSYDVPQDLKNMIGHAAYILSGIKDVVNIKPLKLKLKANDTVYDGEYIFGAICNSTSMGGIISLKESHVDMNDGLFEVMLIKSPANIIDVNQIIFAVTTQTYKDCDLIEFFSAPKIEIETSGDIDWTLDGEFQKGSEKITISNVKGAISIMIP